MGVQVTIPQAKQKEDGTGQLLQLAGLGMTAFGAPAAAAAGTTAAGMLAGGGSAPKPEAQALKTGGSEAQNATTRRLQELQNQKDLTSALNVAQKDPNMSKEYAPVLQNALERARMYGR